MSTVSYIFGVVPNANPLSVAVKIPPLPSFRYRENWIAKNPAMLHSHRLRTGSMLRRLGCDVIAVIILDLLGCFTKK
jgi:hypothetical protein